MKKNKYKIPITVKTKYIGQQSDQPNNYVFAYYITITNNSHIGVRLMSRHWLITDADGNTQEVKGEGVVGEQPFIKVGEEFSYTSYAIIDTPVGCMQGSYQMIDEEGKTFNVPIKSFSLSDPALIH